MKILRFTAPFKPEGKEYIYISLWNRYIRSKFLLATVFVPTLCSLYFILQGVDPYFLSVFILIACYPFFSVGVFLLKIKKHLKFRSPIDTAMTEFTLMSNGILIEREGQEIPELFHWNQFDMCYELKRYILLFKNDTLILMFDKNCIDTSQIGKIRQFILKHMPENKKEVYKKSAVF